MCFGLAPTKAGTPFSRLDKRDSVVDTGTRIRETDSAVVVFINEGIKNALKQVVQGVSRPYRRNCFVMTFLTSHQYP